MIAADMRFYDYYLLGEKDEYGQPQLSKTVQGTVKMSINTISQNIQDNVLYQGSTYIGLIMAPIDDKHIIVYGDRKLKVLYVNPHGRLTQVFMSNYDQA